MHRGKVITAITSLLLSIFLPLNEANAAPSWTLIYETTTSARSGNNIVYTNGYGRAGTAVTNFANSGKTWDLIRVRFEATLSSTLYYADVYFNKWAGATLSGIEFPDITNGVTNQRNVSNLVVSSNYSGVRTGTYALGRLEWWPYNYSPNSGPISPNNALGTYDWDDSFVNGSGDHGSFQIHNLTDTQTVIAWNMHRPGTQELGMGNATSGSHPDWTGASGIWTNAGFKMQIYVGDSVTIGAINQPTYSGQLSKGLTTTLTSTTNGPGRVTFYFKKKRIAGCVKRVTVDVSGTFTANCSFKPPTSGTSQIYAEYEPIDSSFTPASSTVVSVQVLRRSSRR
jgi:hypothetical protein